MPLWCAQISEWAFTEHLLFNKWQALGCIPYIEGGLTKPLLEPQKVHGIAHILQKELSTDDLPEVHMASKLLKL